MKLKDSIIDNEYDNQYPDYKEYTDWIMCMESEYSKYTAKLPITERTNLLFENNTEEYSPYGTSNS